MLWQTYLLLLTLKHGWVRVDILDDFVKRLVTPKRTLGATGDATFGALLFPEAQRLGDALGTEPMHTLRKGATTKRFGGWALIRRVW